MGPIPQQALIQPLRTSGRSSSAEPTPPPPNQLANNPTGANLVDPTGTHAPQHPFTFELTISPATQGPSFEDTQILSQGEKDAIEGMQAMEEERILATARRKDDETEAIDAQHLAELEEMNLDTHANDLEDVDMVSPNITPPPGPSQKKRKRNVLSPDAQPPRFPVGTGKSQESSDGSDSRSNSPPMDFAKLDAGNAAARAKAAKALKSRKVW